MNRKWKRWAVVSNTGLCERTMKCAAAIYRSEYTAQQDCAKGQYVVPVEIRETLTMGKRPDNAKAK